MSSVERPDPDREDVGRLAANGMMVKMLQTALSRAETNVGSIPGLIRQIASREAWRAFLFPDDPDIEHIYRWNAAQFRTFIEAPRPAGCQVPCYLLERFLKGTPAWEVYLELTRGKPGGDNNPYGRAGKPEPGIKCDDVTLDSTAGDDTPVTIPLDPEVPRPHKAGHHKKPPTGNSVSYAVRRLGKAAEKDPAILPYYERVRDGRMSASAAMVEAGLKPREFNVPEDPPAAAARRLALHFHGERLDELIRELQARSRAEAN